MWVIIFPLLYLGAFLTALRKLWKNQIEGLLVFVVFALPVYITSLSVSYSLGFGSWIPALQVMKELLVAITLTVCIWKMPRRFQPTTSDWLVIFFAGFAFLYLLLPLGPYSLKEKAIALKSVSFFSALYFTGRMVDHRTINVKKWLHYICIVSIAAGALVLWEAISDQHLQLSTGYADYNFYFFNVAPAGNYGLTWTFESGSGHKRFASFFSMPLEHAAATLVSFSVLFALSYKGKGKYVLTPFLQLTLVATLLSIVFALSRAAFAGYFIMLYVYAIAAGKKQWLRIIHGVGIATVLVWLVWLKGDIAAWVVETIQFTDSSSLSHLLEWIDGIQSMISHPFGLGLGSSGRIAGELGENIGGENQLIIIGVQLGVIAVGLYGAIYYRVVVLSIRAFRNGTRKEARLGLMLFLSKVGLIVPLMTSEVESYIYISYLMWFLSGLMVNMYEQHEKQFAATPSVGY